MFVYLLSHYNNNNNRRRRRHYAEKKETQLLLNVQLITRTQQLDVGEHTTEA